MYIEMIENIKYGIKYDKIDTVVLERVNDYLKKNKYVYKKLNTAVSKGFLFNNDEIVMWFGFLRALYRLDTMREQGYSEKTAVIELILKLERIEFKEIVRTYKARIKKYEPMVHKDLTNLKLYVENNTEINIEDIEELSVTEILDKLEQEEFTVIVLSDGYFGIVSPEDFGSVYD